MNKSRNLFAPLLVCLTFGIGAVACSDDKSSSDTKAPAAETTVSVAPDTAAPDTTGSGGTAKIGFITKFPVDFYDTMVDAAKAWNADHPEVEIVFAQGTSGTDDEGEINAIESMITQGVQAIVITPTSPNVQDALQKAVDAGINRGAASCLRTRTHAGRRRPTCCPLRADVRSVGGASDGLRPRRLLLVRRAGEAEVRRRPPCPIVHRRPGVRCVHAGLGGLRWTSRLASGH